MKTESFAEQYGLPAAIRWWIVLFPIVVFALFTVAMSLDVTQDFAFNLVKENNVVDWLTSAPAFIGGVLGLRLAMQERRRGKEKMIWLFYFVFALGLIFIAGEETSWGQDFFHFRTPGFFERHNEQGDLTFHNLEGWQGKNHLLRLAFGVGGLVGLRAWKSERFRDVAPPIALRVWFWLIVAKSVLDIYTKAYPPEPMPAFIVYQLSEVVEMLVAMAGLLYVWLNGRRLGRLAVRAS
jgi:hypothetical protein